eukprot:CAMPEP_0172828722 /NCGR_PEP_ID=MMETSP1075-20121228/21036_1 /TAXON_ID=2916 /ORGANISM="Ceratium fusus, Strain PA161109" /LENGTH=210 /DNA_ID=CAMNT_0013670751 /DNA_START=3 /DNA_END=632 /DNA_ORIENTATION=-
MERLIDALLEAQRVFKQEVDDKWATLQNAAIPLQLELQSLRQRGSQERITGSTPLPRIDDPDEGILCNAENSKEKPVSSNKPGRIITRSLTEEEVRALQRAEAAERARDEVNQNKNVRCWRRLLRSHHFDMLMGGLIVANMLLLMLKVQYEGAMIEPGTERPRSSVIDTTFSVFEHFFTAVFLLEMILRLAADGVQYLRSISNGLDGLIV